MGKQQEVLKEERRGEDSGQTRQSRVGRRGLGTTQCGSRQRHGEMPHGRMTHISSPREWRRGARQPCWLTGSVLTCHSPSTHPHQHWLCSLRRSQGQEAARHNKNQTHARARKHTNTWPTPTNYGAWKELWICLFFLVNIHVFLAGHLRCMWNTYRQHQFGGREWKKSTLFTPCEIQ